MESVFSIAMDRWIGQLEVFKKNATKDAFLIMFQNFHKNSFSKKNVCDLLEAFS